MLAFNGEIIDWSSGGKVTTHFKDKFEAIGKAKLRFPIIIKFTPDHIIPDLDDPRKHELSSGVSFRFEQAYRNGDFDGIVTYYTSKTPDRRRPMGGDKFNPRWGKFTGMEVLEEKDRDYLIFMLFVNPHMVLIPELQKHQNEIRSRSHFMFENKIKEEKVIAEQRALLAQVDILLAGGEAGLDDDMLRQIALGYNVTMADDPKFSIYEIGNQLRNQVVQLKNGKYDKRKINEFLENAKFGDRMKMKASIQKAIDQQIIGYFNEPQKEKYWYFIEISEPDGKKTITVGDKIVSVPPNRTTSEQAFNFLVNHYINNESKYKALKELID